MDKLNALAARAMGWALNIEHFRNDCEYAQWVNVRDNSPTLYYDHISQSMWRDPQFVPIACRQWRPAICADDALVLLEKFCIGKDDWMMSCHIGETPKEYFCWLGPDDNEMFLSNAQSAPLAMTLCALRAANIPESEITAAME